MGVSCVSTGRRFLKSISQPVSLTLIVIVFLAFVIIGAVALELYRNVTKSRIDFCSHYINSNETTGLDFETSYIICILCSVVLFTLTVLASVNVSNSVNIRLDIWFPIILGIGMILCIYLAIYFEDKYTQSRNTHTTTLIQDSRAAQWCLSNQRESKDLYYAITVLLGLGIAFFITYITDLTTDLCVVYPSTKTK